ncbi:uncharacterized protein LOC113315312 [Papaver somniferum]|uniref:uncharacterized protein LOC113315312 n=1 Tax=Papaver somniferum TaxID=3469 RepID=UPI000E6F8BFF|nr:uncharacterized protein LOC113315312 [Papaver somniferum]
MGALSYFVINSIRAPHTCDREKLLIKIESASRGLAELFKKKFAQCHSIYTPRQLQCDLERTYKVEVTYTQAFKGCNRGIELIRGSTDESYQHLVGYSHMLADLNQGTLTTIQTDKNNIFEYCFVALGVCLEGFKRHARLAFAVDGTHLTGERLGLVLSVVALDANEQIYPIVFGIVDSENNKACAWFMEKLAKTFGADFSKRKDLVIASDRSRPIRTAVENTFPDATHVFCAYHIKGI